MPVTGRGRGLGKVVAGLAAAATLLAATAAAQDRSVELVTTGPAGNGSLSEFEAASTSEDGTTVAFATSERLVSSDEDDQVDVYVRRGGTTSIASHGDKNGNLAFGAGSPGVSVDGSRVYFTTAEQLVAEDADAAVDVYEYLDGAAKLVSVREANAPGEAADVVIPGRLPPPVGERVVMSTKEQTLTADGDAATDLYVRDGGRLEVLTGATQQDAIALDANRTLTHVYFETTQDLVDSDKDTQADTYMVTGGQHFLVSRTPSATSPSAGRTWVDLVSADGSRAYVVTPEGLDAGDTDGQFDTYLWRADGTITWLSKQTTGQGCARAACAVNTYGGSSDLSRVAFTTPDRLLAADTDDAIDVYAWTEAGGLELVSTGPNGGNGAADTAESVGGRYQKMGTDGRGVLFTTGESLVAEDTDGNVDLYERIDGTTRLLSSGEIGAAGGVPPGTGAYRAESTRVIFASATALTRADTDEQLDVYLHEAGTVRLISVGRAAYDADLIGASFDAGRIFFRTREQLAPEDLDGGRDLYSSRQLPAPPSGGGPVADTTPPELALRLTRTSFRSANRRARMTAKRKRTPIGTFIDAYVNEGGQVNMTFSKLVPGRRSTRTGKCVPTSKRVRKSLRCTKPVSQRGKLEFPTQGGRNRIRFYGRVGSRRFSSGVYVVFARAYDGAGNRSRIVNARFRIKKR